MIRMFLVLLFLLGFITLMIRVNINKTEESQTSVLFKIITNYAQMIFFVQAMNNHMPSPLMFQSLFLPIKNLGNASEQFVSIECVFDIGWLVEEFHNTKIAKIFLMSMLPIVL